MDFRPFSKRIFFPKFNPSKISELQELEHWDKKFAVAGAATEGFFSRRWVAEHLFNMSHEEFIRNQRELFYDRKFDAQLSATAEAMAEEAAGAGLGGGGLEDDLGDLGGEDLGGEDLGDLGGDDLGDVDLADGRSSRPRGCVDLRGDGRLLLCCTERTG